MVIQRHIRTRSVKWRDFRLKEWTFNYFYIGLKVFFWLRTGKRAREKKKKSKGNRKEGVFDE